MSLSLRIAGFEIRDMIMWVYGSGMPKGLNLSKGIDKLLGSAPDSPNKGRWNPGSQEAGQHTKRVGAKLNRLIGSRLVRRQSSGLVGIQYSNQH